VPKADIVFAGTSFRYRRTPGDRRRKQNDSNGLRIQPVDATH
jgi:hypothetical protein